MKDFRVLVCDRFSADAEALLRGHPKISLLRSHEPAPPAEMLEKAHAMIARSRTPIDIKLLQAARELQIAVTCTSGFDHVDLHALATTPHVKVMHTPNANAASAAELTWALILSCARKLDLAARSVKSGDWRREHLVGRELHGLTLGIIGLGRIGTRVAKVARAFDMKVMAFDPYKDENHFSLAGAERVGLDELFRLANIVSCHVPATAETFHMIKPLIFDGDTRDVIFVNTSRGSTIEEAALCRALDEGVFAAAGLDVFEREPLPRHSALLGRENVIMSPHIGATTDAAFQRASQEAAGKVISFVERGEVSDLIPPNEPWMIGELRHN